MDSCARPASCRRLRALHHQLCPPASASTTAADGETFRAAEHPAFECLRVEHVVEYKCDAVIYRHIKVRPCANSRNHFACCMLEGLCDQMVTHMIVMRACGGTAKQTGAELLSISKDDDNKCFGITFRTPPANSRGVAHILEHSVLCGSRKYPSKEPFVTLLKGSLQTFLNAMTYPDRTCCERKLSMSFI